MQRYYICILLTARADGPSKALLGSGWTREPSFAPCARDHDANTTPLQPRTAVKVTRESEQATGQRPEERRPPLGPAWPPPRRGARRSRTRSHARAQKRRPV